MDFSNLVRSFVHQESGLFISHHRFEKWIVIHFLSKCQEALKDVMRMLWHNIYNLGIIVLVRAGNWSTLWRMDSRPASPTNHWRNGEGASCSWKVGILNCLEPNPKLWSKKMNKRSTCATFQDYKNGFPCTCFGLLSLSYLSQPSFVIQRIFEGTIWHMIFC